MKGLSIDTLLHALGCGDFVREYRFHDKRRWRFDYAWVRQRVALEYEGGAYTGGRHVRGQGFERDAEKYNTATLMGWRVFRVTRAMVERGDIGTLIPAALHGCGG